MKQAVLAMAVLSGLALTACSSKVESDAVGFTIEPPARMKLQREEAGETPTAVFAEGLAIRSLQGALPSPESTDLKALLARVKEQAHLELPENVTSMKSGTLPAGPVARYELADATSRTLLYVVTGKERALVLSLTAPKDEYSERQNQLERALATLRFR